MNVGGMTLGTESPLTGLVLSPEHAAANDGMEMGRLPSF